MKYLNNLLISLITHKFTRQIYSIVIMQLMFTQIAAAQDKGLQNVTAEQRAAAQTSMMMNKLNLNSEQLEQVKAINLKYAKKFDPILKSDAGKLSRLQQAKALIDAKEEELKKIFSSSQYNQYEELKVQMREKFKEKRSAN